MDTPVGIGFVVGGGVSGVMDLMLEDSLMSEWLRWLSNRHHSLVLWLESNGETCWVGMRESHVVCWGMSCDLAMDTRGEAEDSLVDMADNCTQNFLLRQKER